MFSLTWPFVYSEFIQPALSVHDATSTYEAHTVACIQPEYCISEQIKDK